MHWFAADRQKYRNLATAWVRPAPRRCVQCGVCSLNCPMALDVRRRVWRDEPVDDARCLTCGECVSRCPRGLLHFGRIGDGVTRRDAGPDEGAGSSGERPRRHVLIGGGPATIAAAEAIRRVDHDAEIAVVCSDPHGYYSRPGLAYLLTGELRERDLFPLAPAELGGLGLTWVDATATAVDPAAHRVLLDDGRALAFDRLLLATGSSAVPADVPGADLDGVVKLDQLDDARDIIARARRAKAAVVVGGGITALEIVEGLRARGAHVHYFLRRDRYWANVLSPYESQTVEQHLRREGVQIHPHTELAAVEGSHGRVTGVRTADGTSIACDLVAVAVGVLPRVEIAQSASLTCARGVLVDEYLRTSEPDIYAAGDVAEIVDARTSRGTLNVLWNVALAKGRIAGLNMAAGPRHTYPEECPLNITRLAGLHTTIIGTVGNGRDDDLRALSRGDSQVWSELGEAAVVETGRGEAHLRLALSERRIEGAVVMGDQSLSHLLQELVESRADVNEIAALAKPLADLICEARDDWRACRVRS